MIVEIIICKIMQTRFQSKILFMKTILTAIFYVSHFVCLPKRGSSFNISVFVWELACRSSIWVSHGVSSSMLVHKFVQISLSTTLLSTVKIQNHLLQKTNLHMTFSVSYIWLASIHQRSRLWYLIVRLCLWP